MSEVDAFMRNELLVREDGTRHRLLAFDVETDQSWLIAMDSPTALPFEEPYSKLPDIYQRLEVVELEVEYSLVARPKMKPLPKPAKPSSIALSERAMRRIEQLVDNPAIFDRAQRNQLLEAHASAGDNGTAKTLLKHLRDYWQGGQTQDALLGRYENCGRPETDGTAMRGRTRADETTPYQIGPEDQEWMRDVIEKFYFDREGRPTLSQALQELHERHYTYVDGNNVLCLKPEDECPTYRQFEYFLKRRYSLEDRLRARLGDKAFEKDHRGASGSVQVDCHGVAHVYEFDATIADVILTSARDRAAIVGKPTLYLIIDRASRLIVGWYVGFENASYTAAIQAILSIGEDKEKLCAELGLPYDPADWVAHRILPESFIMDQGELTSRKARRIARSLRCMLTNVPGLRPDWKPLVECGIAMIHQIISPHAPGYARDADTRQRRGIKHDKKAALNLLEFTSFIVAAIIAHNKTMQTGYPLSISQVADGVPPIPRDLFVHGIRRRMGKLDRMDFDKVRAELMPRDKAKATGDGLIWQDIEYSCPEAEERGWLVAGRRKRKDLDVAFDYRLVDEIVVFSPDGSGESFTASLTKNSVMFKGMALADVTRHKEDEAELKKPASSVKRETRYQFNKHAKKVASQAEAAMKAATKGISYAGRKEDTVEARADELAEERRRKGGVVAPVAKKALVPGVSTSPAKAPARAPLPAPSASTSDLAPVIPIHPPEPVQVPSKPLASRPMNLAERLALARKKLEG